MREPVTEWTEFTARLAERHRVRERRALRERVCGIIAFCLLSAAAWLLIGGAVVNLWRRLP